MTYLQLVNAVLKKLRKSTVSAVAENTYSTLIGEFVNEAKEEVEEAWDWTSLRDILSENTTASVSSVTVTGTNDRTKILRIINDTDDNILRKVSWKYIKSLSYLGTNTDGSPIYWAPNGQTSGELDIFIYPTPDAVETLQFLVKVPQADLSADSDELTVPDRAVVLGAYMRALDERGEDGGTNLNTAMVNYKEALSNYITHDVDMTSGEIDWVVS